MIRCSLILLLLTPAFIVYSAPVDSSRRRPSVPVYYPRSTQPLLGTQLTVSAGTARVARSDKPLFSTSLECKGIYYLTGALYASGGGGFSMMRSLARPTSGNRFERQVFLAYAPAGVGFSIGDDRATIITAVDVIPGFYMFDGPAADDSRRFTYGIAPEFGFLFHIGPRYKRGIDIGMSGKVRFMQGSSFAEGAGLRYSYGGMGLMLRF